MIIETAYALANKLHSGQTRADGITPYIQHPKRVAELVVENGGDENQVAAAWLHDIFEENIEGCMEYFGVDKVTIQSKMRMIRFLMNDGPKFINNFRHILITLSDHWEDTQDKIRKEGKVAYLADLLLHSFESVLLIKLCDILANIQESNGSRMSQEKRYLKAVEILLMSGRTKNMPACHRLAKKIQKLVKEHKKGIKKTEL